MNELTNTVNGTGTYDSVPIALISNTSVVKLVDGLTLTLEADKTYWKDGNLKYTITLDNATDVNYENVKLTDVLDTREIFRLIELVPSPKAEPFKLWLASLGKERIDEVFDPEIAINRAVEYYRKRGYDDKWIKSRLTGIVDRFKLTDIWKESGITKDYEYGILTNEILNHGLE